jgi:hypothetical protein
MFLAVPALKEPLDAAKPAWFADEKAVDRQIRQLLLALPRDTESTSKLHLIPDHVPAKSNTKQRFARYSISDVKCKRGKRTF